jgi:DNA-binding transcriptional MerR regulator/methylmalonyl-CoA mutase cobalamin-binding subunit
MKQHNTNNDLVPIGAVVEALQRDYPDVSHSSLRFLEREGLITPTRTPGGHRLFTAADIQRLRQIKDWQAQRFSLDEIRQRLDERDAFSTPQELAERFLARALAGELETARQTIRSASDLGLPLDVIFLSVLRPALQELGDRWQRGVVSVAEEKEVSHVARDLLAELGMRSAVPLDDPGGDIVAACVPGERHELGLLMVCGLLRARGVRVHFLGVDVAPDFLIDSVRLRYPDAVLLSVTSDEHLPALGSTAEALRGAGVTALLLAGGQAVERHPDIARAFGTTPLLDDDLDILTERLRHAT